ncbi:hypothetical protein ACFV7Q_29665 [Streptomyces sp. NPDC059851]|uniref:hypothetical protein n=1 Tax=Streptomyces sp. NPDC059851 TaxID=3346971 RepID=UPI003646C1C3
MGSARPSFIELAEAFGDALDEWSTAVRQALAGRGRYQNWLARRLGTPPPKVSLWLRGREQIWLSGAGLPGAGTTRAIVRELDLEAAPAAHLARLADRIDHLQRQLEELHPRDWRKRTEEHLRPPRADTSPPPQPTRPAADDTPEPNNDSAPTPPPAPAPGRRWTLRPLTTRRAAAAAVSVVGVVIVAAGLTYLGPGRTAHPGTPGAAATPAAVHTPTGTDESGPALERPGLEKDTLGPDSRCGEPLPGPEAVVWRVCTRVEADRISFAVKLTNQADRATTARVRVRVQYVRAKVFHPCPMAPNAQPVDVPAGKTVITDPGRCSVSREQVPFAYQGVGWVIPANATAGSYELSPTAHVYPDRTLWKPDLL